MRIPSIARSLPHFLYTMYLFTVSDIMTILLPTNAFGSVAAGTLEPRRFMYRALWVWLHLLQFCVSNQCHSDPVEDQKNKPWRPIPSGRISTSAARRLRWTLLVVCLIFSANKGALAASAALSIGTISHNELDLGAHWITRNMLNAAGYASFNIGSGMVGCEGTNCTSGSAPVISSQLLIALVICTTIQTQDFKDMEGDRLAGRGTLPLVYPVGSRVVTVGLVPLWSLLFASRYWDGSAFLSIGCVVFGILTAARLFLGTRTRGDDTRAYMLYNIWLCFLHVLPFMAKTST